MKTRSAGWGTRVAIVAGVLLLGARVAGGQTNTGYMGFLSPTHTAVTAGDAASYMRAGTDWDQLNVVAGVAVPNKPVAPTVTTWRDGTSLHFSFVIPDQTTKAGGATLACGDQVIIQIDQTNAKSAHLDATHFHRYEYVIKNLAAPTITHRIPLNIGGTDWIWDAPIATSAGQSGFSAAGNKYSFEATIPLAEIGNPATDVGLAMAIINDLGHSHGAGPINEATGVAFPIGMGLTHESDPGLSCGATVDATEGPTGNWVNPSTWGVAYFDTSGVARDVTLDQNDSYYLSKSIKLGDCSVTNWNDMVSIPNAPNWDAVQASDPHWYKYHATKPCRMGVWINAKVNGAGVVNRRFLVLWGVPNAGGTRDWTFVGVTNPTPVAAPATAVSILWNDVPLGAFSHGHPCLRVYVLPATLTPAQITTLQAINSQATIDAMEATYAVTAISTNYSAQMNFGNMDAGSCSGVCLPISAAPAKSNGFWDRFGLVSEAYASQPTPQTNANDTRPKSDGGGDDRPKLIRIIARAFGVSDPRPKKQYVFIETIGGLGWAVPTTMLGNVPLQLPFEAGNPALVEKIFVGGKPIEIRSVPRRIIVAATVDVPKGVPAPRLDLGAVERLAAEPVAPGHLETVQIAVARGTTGGDGGTGGSRWWIWALVALVIVIIIVAFARRNP